MTNILSINGGTPIAPALTDVLYGADDPAGTPADALFTPAGMLLLAGITMTSGTHGIAGPSLTAAEAFGTLALTQTWNTTGAPTAILANITNTASGTAAKLLDLQIAGTSVFSVAKTGATVIASGTSINTDILTLTGLSNTLLKAVIGATFGASHVQVRGEGFRAYTDAGLFKATFSQYGYVLTNDIQVKWTSNNNNPSTGQDVGLLRGGVGVLKVTNATTGSGALLLSEMTAPAAIADGCLLFSQDNGSGKTQLMARFATGAAVQVAIEP